MELKVGMKFKDMMNMNRDIIHTLTQVGEVFVEFSYLYDGKQIVDTIRKKKWLEWINAKELVLIDNVSINKNVSVNCDCGSTKTFNIMAYQIGHADYCTVNHNKLGRS